MHGVRCVSLKIRVTFLGVPIIIRTIIGACPKLGYIGVGIMVNKMAATI